jgi:putative membrane protein
MMWQWFGGGYWWMWLMPVIMIVFVCLGIWAIFALSRGFGHHVGCCGASGHSTNSALELLKQRYARGEINKQEFEEKKQALV